MLGLTVGHQCRKKHVTKVYHASCFYNCKMPGVTAGLSLYIRLFKQCSSQVMRVGFAATGTSAYLLDKRGWFLFKSPATAVTAFRCSRETLLISVVTVVRQLNALPFKISHKSRAAYNRWFWASGADVST